MDLLYYKLILKNDILGDTIDFMVENCKEANWSALERALKIMESGFVKKGSYTDRFTKWVNKEANKMFQQDMIYYTICYDGFRL